ncbi:OLC1v1006768C1 [Oldenlandia corymbosa var. corymbosa]|uniref:OLC1v1006768C1 n=1 Tax=Oldenlandia corymbosa var. corymbosa TaxID=529605 RepID=A0AAV1DIE2_OLDCO|nr:OLC1v1006768C1 [Oldenlandia corymbosa var. corymbosa]
MFPGKRSNPSCITGKFLEWLEVHMSEGLINLEVFGPSLSLKHQEICDCYKMQSLVVRNVVNLLSIKITKPEVLVLLQSIPLLTHFHVRDRLEILEDVMLRCSCYLSKLEVLTLHFEYMKSVAPIDVLTREWPKDIKKFKDSGYLLKYYLPYTRKQHLKVVELVGYQGIASELELVNHFTITGVCMENIIIDPRRQCSHDRQWVHYVYRKVWDIHMEHDSRSIFVFLILSLALGILANAEEAATEAAAASDSGEEEFSEALLLRPLPDRKVLAHFHFQSRAPSTNSYGHHHHLFPKSIYQLVQKFHLQEMELSFTQGRWNYERWGGYDPISTSNAKPPGVELWAVFDVPHHQVDASWKNLTHALSGLFCASINFLEDSTAYSSPQWSFKSSGGKLRYGTLPREAVCTENLTPWLKLLPCRDKAGLSTLMDRPSIYRGYYHSQRLRLSSDEYDKEISSGIVLDQTLTIVLQPDMSATGEMLLGSSTLQPNWSLNSLFGRKVNGKCVLSKSSNVYIHLEQNLLSELTEFGKKNKGSHSDVDISGSLRIDPGLEIPVPPSRLIRVGDNLSNLYEFPIENYSESKPFDLGFRWKFPVVWSCQQAPLSVSRYLMGSGNERGSIAISLKSNDMSHHLLNADSADECQLKVNIFQVVPWYVKVYYHTLQVFIDGNLQPLADSAEKIQVSPSEDKVSPGVLEMTLRLPCEARSAAISLDFDKGFLHIDEYPPDANQGFDIPSALVVFGDFETGMHFSDESLSKIPIFSKLQERNKLRSYTEVLLVPLTTPDFSMPYNVITITCTVFALYFGSLLNALRWRAGQEERLLKSKASKKAGPLRLLLRKLFGKSTGQAQEQPTPSEQSSSSFNYKLMVKVLLVAGLAVAWQYYST